MEKQIYKGSAESGVTPWKSSLAVMSQAGACSIGTTEKPGGCEFTEERVEQRHRGQREHGCVRKCAGQERLGLGGSCGLQWFVPASTTLPLKLHSIPPLIMSSETRTHDFRDKNQVKSYKLGQAKKRSSSIDKKT